MLSLVDKYSLLLKALIYLSFHIGRSDNEIVKRLSLNGNKLFHKSSFEGVNFFTIF